MGAVLDRLVRVHLMVMIVLYVIVIAVVFLQVVYRYVLHTGLLWSGDVAVAAFLWLAFLATAYVVRRRADFVIDLMPRDLSPAVEIAVRSLSELASLAIILVLLYYGWLFTLISIPSFTPALGISRAWIAASIPVSGVLALIYWLSGVRDAVVAPR